MNPFRKRTAILIAGVSALLASISGPIAWYVARENAEESIVSLAMEESGRLLHRHHAINLGGGRTRLAVPKLLQTSLSADCLISRKFTTETALNLQNP